MEKLPQPLPLVHKISDTLRSKLMDKMRICSQMNSVVDYHTHVHQMVSIRTIVMIITVHCWLSLKRSYQIDSVMFV